MPGPEAPTPGPPAPVTPGGATGIVGGCGIASGSPGAVGCGCEAGGWEPRGGEPRSCPKLMPEITRSATRTTPAAQRVDPMRPAIAFPSRREWIPPPATGRGEYDPTPPGRTNTSD